jgi:RHS repeat-associated protein
MTESTVWASRSGKDRGQEAGLGYFGAEYCESSKGHFMSRDSGADATVGGVRCFADSTNPQSLKLYSYVVNNPLSNVDSDGHDYHFCADNGNGVKLRRSPLMTNSKPP